MRSLIVLTLSVFVLFGCSSPTDESTLIEKDGLMFEPNSDTPYSGDVVGYYSTGEVSYEGQYVDGKIVDWYSYYNRDGSPKLPVNTSMVLTSSDDSTFFTKDTHEPYTGPVFEHSKYGKKMYEGFFKNGLRDGLWSIYDQSGVIFRKGSYRNGQWVGKWEEWYMDGTKSYEGDFVENKPHGVVSKWDEFGRLSERIEYKHGTYHGMFEWYYGGSVQKKGKYVDGKREGMWIETTPDCTVVNYSNDYRLGTSTTYFDTGEKKEEGEWVPNPDGDWTSRDGVWTTWYKNGNLESETTYVMSKKHGSSTHFYENGGGRLVTTYYDDRKEDIRTFYDQKGNQYSGELVKYYDVQGKKNGSYLGYKKEYNQPLIITTHGSFKDYKGVGLYTEFNDDGTIKKQKRF